MKQRFFHLRAPAVIFAFPSNPDGTVDYEHVQRRFDYGRFNPRGGATVRVEPVNDNGSICKVSVAFCSRHDQYSRKLGREKLGGEIELFRELIPDYLASIYDHMLKRQRVPITLRYVPDFSNVVKMFTPKAA